jgi:predicted ATPase/class 3 adenylate cyclase
MGLPTGPAVTFLFTDIEGSTRLERALGSAEWATVVARHDGLLREAIEANGGVVVKTEGDAFFAAFDRPAGAAAAAVAAQRAVAAESWPDGAALRVRMGLHLGEGRLRHGRAQGDPEDYVGIDVNYAARIAAAGNGGQIVLSHALVEALDVAPAADSASGADGPRGVDGQSRADGVRAIEGIDDVGLADEGLRAVKDFEEPQRLHRIVVPGAADDDRPLRTLEAPSNLPASATELVGREHEVELVRDALAGGRLVTLTGPGGCGKTRLALGVARSVRDRFPHGTWFVDLAAVRDPALVESSIAATLGVRDTPDQPIATTLRNHLRDRTALLLLDNLEQLLPTAAHTVAEVVRNAPRVRLLVTSRELLRISGENGHPVPPLDEAAGVELFEARARALRPDLALTDETRPAIRGIANRLGGLPLAIELAAARVRMMSPTLILERLGTSLDLSGVARDVPERQRTLRGAIAWSHDLLSDPERRLFRRLAVFAGGWTVEPAFAVVDPEGDLGVDLLAGLDSLADKSLVRIQPAGEGDGAASGEARFDLHPLLREFALERLVESGERVAVEARHAEAYVTLAETAGKGFLTGGGAAILRSLDPEIHNLRAALEWSLAIDQPEVGLRILGATWRWFQQRGRLREARALLAQLLARPGGDPGVRIAGLAAEGGLAYWMSDIPAARVAYDERLALAEEVGDPVLLADAHYDIGFLSMVGQDAPTLRDHEQRALDLYQAAGREDGVLRARQALVLGVFLSGEYEEARRLEEQNLEVFESTGSVFQIADSMTLLSAIKYRVGDVEGSWRRMAEGLRRFEANDSASGLARALGMAGILLLEAGELEFGARVTGATMELVREKGVMLAPVTVLHLPHPRDIAIERLGVERAEELMAAGAAEPLAQVTDEVLAAKPPSGALAH